MKHARLNDTVNHDVLRILVGGMALTEKEFKLLNTIIKLHGQHLYFSLNKCSGVLDQSKIKRKVRKEIAMLY